MQAHYYIVEITIGTQTFRFSSGGDVMVGGYSYIDGLSVDDINDDDVQLTIANVNNSAASLFLNLPMRNAGVKLTHILGNEQIPVFDGEGDHVIDLIQSKAVIRAVSYAGMSRFPVAEVAPPVINHATKDGTVIPFGGKTYTVGVN